MISNFFIQIIHGPMIMLRLRAHVTMPDMEVSDDVLDFTQVKCGECKVITVQLHNHQNVKCEWDSFPPDDAKQVSYIYYLIRSAPVMYVFVYFNNYSLLYINVYVASD